MRFKRLGKTAHICVETADDLFSATLVDPARWMTLSAPANAFSLDSVFISHLCDDQGQRIIYDSVIDAISWLESIFSDHRNITHLKDILEPNTLNTEHNDALAIKTVINEFALGNMVSLDQIRACISQTTQNSVSQTGVITPSIVADPRLKAFINKAVIVTGGISHPNGEFGIDASLLQQIISKINAYLDWYAIYSKALTNSDLDLLPFGSNTDTLYKQFDALKPKLDEYFQQSQSLQFGESLLGKVDIIHESNFENLNWQDKATLDNFLRNAPLAQPNQTVILSMDNMGLINPIYGSDLIEFLEKLFDKLGWSWKSQLPYAQYQSIKAMFQNYERWLSNNPCPSLDGSDLDELAGYTDDHFTSAFEVLFATAEKTRLALRDLQLAEKATLYQHLMITFARNYIGLVDIYQPELPACFEKGKLLMNGYHFNFAIGVPNISEHKRLSDRSHTFLLYLTIENPQQSYNIVVPVTRGSQHGFIKGKRGVFIDRYNHRYDAIITDILPNPINLYEAIIEPLKKIQQIFSKKIDDDAATQQQKLANETQKISSTPLTTSKGIGLPLNPATMIMGGGIAIAALSSSLVYIINTIANASLNSIAITLGCIIAAIFIPTTIAGICKLRKRNLTPILEGSTWAINQPMHITRKVARTFTIRPNKKIKNRP